MMSQSAPWPFELESLVRSVEYKKGWTFSLEHLERDPGCEGLTFIIRVMSPNSYHPDQMRHTAHYFPVPGATYNRRSWRHWLFKKVGLVEDHERAEFFKVDGERPYPPNHGAGDDPYMIVELGSLTDAERAPGQ